MPSDRTLAGPCSFHFTQRMFSPVPPWYLAGWTCPQQLTISTRLSTAIQSFLEKRREAQSFPYKLFPYRLQPTNRFPAKFQNWTQGDLIKWVLLVSFDLVWPKPLLGLYNNRRSIEDQLTWVKIQTASEFTGNKFIQWWANDETECLSHSLISDWRGTCGFKV